MANQITRQSYSIPRGNYQLLMFVYQKMTLSHFFFREKVASGKLSSYSNVCKSSFCFSTAVQDRIEKLMLLRLSQATCLLGYKDKKDQLTWIHSVLHLVLLQTENIVSLLRESNLSLNLGECSELPNSFLQSNKSWAEKALVRKLVKEKVDKLIRFDPHNWFHLLFLVAADVWWDFFVKLFKVEKRKVRKGMIEQPMGQKAHPLRYQ